MTHNYSVIIKVIPFLLWTKGSDQSPNFETFKCSGENLLNFSCHFSNHKSVSLQIFITIQCHERYLFCTFVVQTLNTLHNRNKSKCKFWRFSSARVKFHQILVIFETADQLFVKFCINLQGHEI